MTQVAEWIRSLFLFVAERYPWCRCGIQAKLRVGRTHKGGSRTKSPRPAFPYFLTSLGPPPVTDEHAVSLPGSEVKRKSFSCV